jgi:hypothetical protein
MCEANHLFHQGDQIAKHIWGNYLSYVDNFLSTYTSGPIYLETFFAEKNVSQM